MARLTWETKAGRIVLSSCGALVALALIGGGYYWWGGPHERRVARQVLDEACGGVLPSDEIRAVLGEGPFEKGPGRSGPSDTEQAEEGGKSGIRQVSCAVQRDEEHGAGHPTHDASVAVTVRSVPERKAADTAADRVSERPRDYELLPPLQTDGLPPAALGSGWRGVFSTDEGFDHRSGDESATTSVLLDCARDRGGLLVTVDVHEEDVTLDDPRRRTTYARIATATAAKASRKWGCDAALGEPLRTVALPVNADEDVALADVSGTCRGLPARGSRVSRAWEDARSGGPVEVCVLGGDGTGMPAAAGFADSTDEARRYQLVAYYGPFAQDARVGQQARHGRYSEDPVPGDAPAGHLAGGGHWASAACEDGGGPALFTVRPSDASDGNEYGKDGKLLGPKTSAADLAYERAALKEFARRSASAHGCAAPKLP
ncbi:hypothetical protein [Streptomyces kanamyceticus]|uniref:Aromatic ring-opening dioxygenase LigA n=1 Tax=Streptomyces kanamyceticus TaxID=1967 RepID=A0A5J6G8U5_STRKN|nr:hypothetical protein [Streptomyces kanamyceticus]QEU91032.1 hypothetical protein CP970_09195 [Streptomyces kanamyceticus]